jgi:RND family efflux transporter MFP subunit
VHELVRIWLTSPTGLPLGTFRRFSSRACASWTLRRFRHSWPVLVAALLTLGGCAEAPPPATDAVRSVKTLVVDAEAVTQQRQIAGVLAASRVAALSFAVPGTVREVLVDQGMSVSAGQVLARLDSRNYDLALSAAQARLASARATLEERRMNFERQQTLFEKKLVARSAFDRATAELGTARAQVAAAESDVDRARRDIERTALVAPYAGTVAARDVEPFQEVAEGAVVFTLQGGAGILAEVLVPESLIRDVAYGDPVRVRFPTIPDAEAPGTVSEIGSRVEAGNAFPVRVRIDTGGLPQGADLRPGLSARVVFDLARDQKRNAVLIPLAAIAIGQGDPQAAAEEADAEVPQQAPVFVFDPDSSTVRKVTVLPGDIRGNLVEIYEGLEPGDRVVVAGVAFLRDGMPARLWTPDI